MSGGVRRLLWFVALYACSLVVFGAVTFAIRSIGR